MVITNKDYFRQYKRLSYEGRKDYVYIDLNSFYIEYLKEIKSLGFSLHKISQMIGLQDNMLNKLLKGELDKNFKTLHIYKIGLITGHHFDFGRYTYLMPSKDDLIKELETLQPTKKHNKNK